MLLYRHANIHATQNHRTNNRQLDPAGGPRSLNASLLTAIARLGERTPVRVLFTLGKPGVRAWDVPHPPDPRCIDLPRYRILLERAVDTVLTPIQHSVTGGADRACLYLFPPPACGLLRSSA